MAEPLMSRRRGVLPSTLVLLLCVWVGLPAPAPAQTPGEMVTDRPDQTESPVAVAPGYVQLELGWSYVEAGAVQLHSVPATLARVGVVRGLEVRLGFAGWRHLEAGGTEATQGAGPLGVGVKGELLRGQGLKPAVALLGELLLPTAAEGLGPTRVDPSVRVALAHVLSDAVSLSYNVGVAWRSERQESAESRTWTQGLYTLSLGVALGQRVGAFAEAFGTVPLTDGSFAAHLLDGGFTVLVLPNLQLDLSAGVGLDGDADDWFVGAGASLRVPR
jgi:hypothetical protein